MEDEIIGIREDLYSLSTKTSLCSGMVHTHASAITTLETRVMATEEELTNISAGIGTWTNMQAAVRPLNIEVMVIDQRVLDFGLPTAQTPGSAGLDLRVLTPTDHPVVLQPGAQEMFSTGLSIWIKDHGYAGFMFARSGTGTKGLVLGNGTGVIDADYQGPLKICLWNRGDRPITIANGDRVAQLVIMPIATGYSVTQVDDFSDTTQRGTGGFGSTGSK